MLAPQVDITKGWARPHANTPPVSIRLALEILDAVEKEYSIDPERVYVAGQSMGGEGVWSALAMSQNKFAGAIALCGYGDASMIPRVAKVPVWIFQGQADPVVNVEIARAWVASLKQAGGNAEVHGIPGDWPRGVGCCVQRTGIIALVVFAAFEARLGFRSTSFA